MQGLWPEFLGTDKMTINLSAVDEQLRHAPDASGIGIILCKDKECGHRYCMDVDEGSADRALEIGARFLNVLKRQ